jgi:hypothetical protein
MESLDVKIVITVIAAIVSFIGLIIAKDNKISEFRQAWINDFRSDVSSLMGCVSNISSSRILSLNSESNNKTQTFLEDNQVLFNQMHQLSYKLKFMLNPEKDIKLITAVNDIESMIMHPDKLDDLNLYKSHTESLYLLSHITLKKEWERVKKGEVVYYLSKIILGTALILFTVYSFFV